MRIWHEQLIPLLCRQHLLATWREGLGAYAIITQNKKGYRNHPAVIEFAGAPDLLYKRLKQIRKEMLNRNFNPKELPDQIQISTQTPKRQKSWYDNHIWQTLEEQTEVLKAKKCNCKI